MKTKTHLGKRVLSVVLSVLMVVTMLPTFAITASATGSYATSSDMIAEFFKDEQLWKDSVSNTNQLSWVSGGWHTYDRSTGMTDMSTTTYLSIGSTVSNELADVSSSTGITFSFRFQPDMNQHRHIISLGQNAYGSGETNHFYITGGPTWFHSGNRALIVVYQNGSGETLMCRPDYEFDGSTTYDATISITSSGVDYYINGVHYNTVDYNDTNTVANRNAALNAIAGYRYNYIGRSRYGNDGNFTGKLKDFRIYKRGVTTDNFAAFAVDRYESMMSSGDIYTKTLPAYKAYVDYCEAKDAEIYGGLSNKISATIPALVTKTEDMWHWTPYSGTADMYFGTIATGAYSNVLYAPGEGTAALSFTNDYVGVGYKDWATDKRAWFKGAAPSSVVLYYNGDLSKLYFPVGFEAYGTTNSDRDAYRTINYVDINDDANLELTRYWHGYQQGWNDTYGIHYLNTENNTNGQDKNDGDHCSVGYSSSNTKNHILSKDGRGKNRFWVNIAHIKALSSDNTLSKTSMTFRLKITKSAGNNITNPGSASVSTGIYVVNYKQLTDAINGSKKTYLSHVTDYKEGGLATLMAKYDQATGYNIESTDYSTTASTYYTNAQAHCTTYASELNGVSTPTADNANNYIKLRSYLTNGLSGTFDFGNGNVTLTAKQIFENAAYNADNLANYGDSTSGFYKAYLDAVNHMAALPATTNVSDYNGSTAAYLATELQSAFNRLSVKAPIDPPTISGNTYLGPTDTVTIHGGNVGASPAVTVWYDVYYDVDSTDAVPSDNSKTFAVDTTESKTLVLFPDNTHTKAIVKAYGKAANSSTDVVTSSVVFKNYNAPTADKADNAVITSGGTITVTKSSCGADGDIKYQIQPLAPNAGEYGATQTGASINPFPNGYTKVNVKIWEEKNGSTSGELVISNLVLKTTAPTIAATVDNGTAYLDADDTITITNTDTGAETLYHFARSTNGTPSSSYGEDATYNAAFAPFDRIDSDVNATYRIQAKSSRHGDVSDYSTPAKDFYYLTAPTVKLTGSNDPLEDNTIFASGNTVTLGNTNGYTGTIKYRVYDVIRAQYLNDWTSYTSAFNPFTVGTGSTKVNVEAVQYVNANTISGVKTVSNLVLKPNDPTIDIATGTYLDLDDLITITGDNTGNVNSAVTYDYRMVQGETDVEFSDDYSVPFAPFGNVSAANYSVPATYTITPYSTRNGSTSDGNRTYTYHFLSTPTIDKTADAELAQTDLVTITRTSGASGTLQYSISRDGESWSGWADCSGTFAPFNVSGYQSDLILYVKVRERISANTISPASTAVRLIKKVDTYTMYWVADSDTQKANPSTKDYTENGKFYISDTMTSSYSGKSVYYQAFVDGVAKTFVGGSTFAAYNINSGIDSDDYTSNDVVEFKFYVLEDNKLSVVATGAFVNRSLYTGEDDEMLLYQESFNGTLSDGAYARSNALGLNGVANNNVSILEKWAAYTGTNYDSYDDGAVKTGYYGLRKNVLKLNASTTTKNYIQFGSPLVLDRNAAIAKANGVTLSYWRAFGADIADGKSAGLYFETSADYYLAITADGELRFKNGSKYAFIKTRNNDYTEHATGTNLKPWVNIATTIDPSNGVTIYINGVAYEMSMDASTVGYTNNAELAQDILAFLAVASSYQLGGNDSANSNGTVDTYLDDVRFYTSVKTQVDINNMFADSLTDAYADGIHTKYSTSHDPTNVTVYTLGKNISYTVSGVAWGDSDTGKTVNLSAGTTVGKEVIEYLNNDTDDSNNLDLSVIGAGHDITKIEYYSFGTGMTVYKSDDNINWTVIGDDAGRCGYQNQKLFGGEYTTAIAEALNYAKGEGSGPGAGYLVWAPHVMFNLYTGTWMYYGSTSSWGRQRSSIFLCEGAVGGSVEGPYTYDSIIYKSYYREGSSSDTAYNTHPNAIDPCVYYQYDSNGKPRTDALLCMVFGSWGGSSGIALKTLYQHGNSTSEGTADYGTNFNTNYDTNGIIAQGMVQSGSAEGSSVEGAYVVYRDGYYYLTVAFGQNTGTYTTRVFRSQNPKGDFVAANGDRADNPDSSHNQGNTLVAPYNITKNDYTFTSTGHGSIYTVYNTYGEAVDLSAVHSRPFSRIGDSIVSAVDGINATCQTECLGNVAIHNPVAYTEDGWQVAFPLTYDETFSTQNKGVKGKTSDNEYGRTNFTAFDIEGVYECNVLHGAIEKSSGKNYVHAVPETFNIIAADNTSGTLVNTNNAKGQYFELSYNDDNTVTYITLYNVTDSANPDKTIDGVKYNVHGRGVIANQGTEGHATPEFSYLIEENISQQNQHVWGVKVKEYPRDEVNAPAGSMVEMDEVVYTHLANGSAEKYGQEISDDINYLDGTGNGERVTTLKVTYPYYIDTSDPNSIICLNDADFVAKGYSAGKYSVTAVKNSSGGYYFDSNGDPVSTPDEECYRYYVLTGRVSDYFHYFDNADDPFDDKENTNVTGYPEHGLQLLIRYKNETDASKSYGEYKFPFVMPNPAMAHTVVGIRNLDNSGGLWGIERRYGHAIFTRFDNSFGFATNQQPTAYKINATVDGDHQTLEYSGNGNFKYLFEFPKTAASKNNSNYSGADTIDGQFDKYSASEGTNSGSYHLIEHYNSDVSSDTDNGKTRGIYTASAKVVDADYYIDYSDKSLYGSLITTNDGTKSGDPTGYSLKFFASNLYWSPHLTETDDFNGLSMTNSRINRSTSYVKNATDIPLTINTPTYNSSHYLKANTYATNDSKDKYKLGGIMLLHGQTSGDYGTVISSLTSDGSTSFAKLTPGFTITDNNYSSTADWQGTMQLNGSKFKNVEKAQGNTAEAASNFVFEEGLHGKIEDYGYTGEETFHYYNIGVSTCDKGAVRNFTDRWAFKEMEINDGDITDLTDEQIRGTDTEKGAITTIEEKEVTVDGVSSKYINAANYSAASYNDYLDAVAKAYWFVYNPKNTHMSDYDSSMPDTAYTTAYGEVNGGYHQKIYHAEKGEDIFGDNDGSTQTDEVQAKIIADVLIAYKNLFNKDDYQKAKTEYGSIHFYDDEVIASENEIKDKTHADPDDVKTITVTVNQETKTIRDNEYTADSWTNFVDLIQDIDQYFTYYVDRATETESTSWRYAELSGEDYRGIESLISFATESLMPAVDTTGLQSEYDSKYGNDEAGDATGTVTGGIYTSAAKTVNPGEESERSFAADDQVYTLGSWKALNTSCSTANTKLAAATNTNTSYQYKDDTGATKTFKAGKYNVTGVKTYKFGDETYYAQEFTHDNQLDSDHYVEGSGESRAYTHNCSTIQGQVYDAYNDIKDRNLTLVDDAACYTTYDNANTVVSAVDMDKFTAAGQEIISNALSTTKNAVYASDDDLTAYNTKFSTNLTAADKVKKTTTGETDPQSAALLSAINTVNNTHVDAENENSDYKYIKYFDASFTVQQTNSESASYSTSNKVMYGDSVDFTIPNGMDSKPVVNWGVTTFKGVSGSVGDAITSQKLSGFQGTSITRVVTSNIAVVAEVDPESVAKDTIQYNILDCYGHLAEVKYVSKDTVIVKDDKNVATVEEVRNKIDVEPKQIPFYTCSSWEVTENSATLITLKPLYSTKKTFDYTFIGATTEGQNGVLYDTKVQVAFDTTKGNFAAWAVKVDDKYQIASYSQSYSFYACANETYVAIINTGTDEAPVYKTVQGTPITASNLDGAITETGKIGSDAFVTQKIHDKMAFVSVENVQMEGTKVRLYVRITEGATEPTGYGVLVRKDYTGTDANMVIGAQGVTRKVVTSKLSTGQFTYTINKSAGFTTGDAVSFRAFVNYDFSYTDVGTTVSINALDYSRTLKVQKS